MNYDEDFFGKNDALNLILKKIGYEHDQQNSIEIIIKDNKYHI